MAIIPNDVDSGMISYTPVQASELTNVTAICGGEVHTIALDSDGAVWSWGRNYYGQLGAGDKYDSKTPMKVSVLTDVTAVAAGRGHSIVLKSDGKVWCWGLNIAG
jgi:alpha-tubulin suppressor-like RCC1 family protein